MKKMILILLCCVGFSYIYAADTNLTVSDLSCLQTKKGYGEAYKSLCLPSSKPEDCSQTNYDKLKGQVKECDFRIRGSLREALGSYF